MKFVIEWWIYTHTPFGLSLKKGDENELEENIKDKKHFLQVVYVE